VALAHHDQVEADIGANRFADLADLEMGDRLLERGTQIFHIRFPEIPCQDTRRFGDTGLKAIAAVELVAQRRKLRLSLGYLILRRARRQADRRLSEIDHRICNPDPLVAQR